MAREPTIERLSPPVGADDLRALAALLADAVASGAAVSFLAPFESEDAEAWWRATLANAPTRAVFLVARDPAGTVVGTVQLQPAWAPNQSRRAELVKLLVDRRCRRMGLGERLMRAAEAAAREAGLDLLTLDAKRGGPAERLYRRLGWRYVGAIPRFALDPDGVTPHDAVIFFKEMNDDHGGERDHE